MYEFTVLTRTAYTGDYGVCCPVAAETASFCMPHTSIVFTLPNSVTISALSHA